MWVGIASRVSVSRRYITSCDWLAEKFRKGKLRCNDKKLIASEMTSYLHVAVLFRLTLRFCLGEPISLEIFLISFTVCLREVILDTVDPE